MQTLKSTTYVNAVIAHPMMCSECARLKGPALRAYNYHTHSTATLCLPCYSSLSESGSFDKPQILKGGA